MTDTQALQRLRKTAGALADAVQHERGMVCQDMALQAEASDAVEAALNAYRSADAMLAEREGGQS